MVRRHLQPEIVDKRGTKLTEDCGRCVLSPVANYDSPSCRDSTGLWAFLKEGLWTIIAGTGSGPEGSKPTAGNCRLQV